MKTTLMIERLDKDYKVLERREIPSLSFVKGFISLLYVMHAQIASGVPWSMPDITNAARNVDSTVGGAAGNPKGTLRVGASGGGGVTLIGMASTSTSFQYEAIENEKLGIVVGVDAGGPHAVTPTDYALVTRVVHGRAGAQLEYSGCGLVNLLIAGAVVSFDIERYFANRSGGPISISECGIYAAGVLYGGTGLAWAFCIARDLVAPAVVVADTELLRVRYTPSTTV